jgi:hypothetical protein
LRTCWNTSRNPLTFMERRMLVDEKYSIGAGLSDL